MLVKLKRVLLQYKEGRGGRLFPRDLSFDPGDQQIDDLFLLCGHEREAFGDVIPLG